VSEAVPWAEAWHAALYGAGGFFRRPEGPAAHFRTAAHAARSGLLGQAIARLARSAGCTGVLDVGAGRGELLRAVHAADAALRCTGVDVVPRPAGLPPEIGWEAVATAAPPLTLPPADRPTLLVGWELLDVVPCRLLETDAAGVPRVVEVDRAGDERLGEPAGEEDLTWCARWWPLTGRPGQRVEVGSSRDRVWAGLVDALAPVGGLALAVDYGHVRGTRPALGTLTGYRAGRQVQPRPDGATDITAHVALDAVAAAAPAGRLLRQQVALRGLGVTGRRPSLEGAVTDPTGYLAALAAAGEAAELTDPGGLGGFGWVLHPVGDHAVTELAQTVTKWTCAPAG
jgi:SAM-dependent MidA family methyltransferase